MQADVYSQLTLGTVQAAASIGLTQVTEGSLYSRAAQITSNPAGEINLISRTHWIGVEFGDGRALLRAGRLNLPFGVRTPEHVLWARVATRTDRESNQQHGLALAWSAADLRWEAMLIAGNFQISPDRFRERGYSTYIEGRLSPDDAIGISSMVTRAEQDRITYARGGVIRQAHGIFARLTLASPLVLLGEMDIVTMTRHDAGYAGFSQLDFEPLHGVHLLGTAEILDVGYRHALMGGQVTSREPGFGKPKFGGWLGVDWFFFSQLEARLDFVMRQNENSRILVQLHAYL
jgi:hypothetical protein